VEDRYLKSRVVIESGSAVAALRALQRELRRNAVVSITVSDATAEPNEVVLPGGKLRVSGGPVELAALTGSALFPVFSRRTRSGFLVRIGAAVAGSEWSDGVEEALIRFGAQLEAAIREAPDQWTGWRTGSFSASEPPGA
jgi:lauroyl/myristoyl acyltransferase